MAQGHKPAGSSDGGQFTRSTKGASPQQTMEDIHRELGAPQTAGETTKEYYDRLTLLHKRIREIKEEETRRQDAARREDLDARIKASQERTRASDERERLRLEHLLGSIQREPSTERSTPIRTTPTRPTPARSASIDWDSPLPLYGLRPTVPMDEDLPIDRERCTRCGQFMAETGHTCPKIPFKQKAAFAVSVGGTMAVAAGAIALGPIAVAAVVMLGAAGYGLKRLIARKVSPGKDSLKKADELRRTNPAWVEAETMVQDIAHQLEVPGEIVVIPRSLANPDGSPMINAAALRKDKKNSIVFISPELLDLPVEQQKGIIAHEVAHLQKSVTGRGYQRLKSVAVPVAVAGGAISGLALLPAVAVAGTTWFMVYMAANAASRMEERRADREAYKIAGEEFGHALHTVHDASPQGYRRNLIWRMEDMLFTHGALPNRLRDMRKRALQQTRDTDSNTDSSADSTPSR